MGGSNASRVSRETVTLAKGGKDERTVNIRSLDIPDLWHIAMMMENDHRFELHAKAVLDVWHIAHDLKRELIERL